MTPDRWHQIDALFHEALARPPEDRAAFLDAACAGDPELRAEVEALLEADTDSLAVLDASRDQLAALLPDTEPKIAQHIGPYRVLREVGRGGMGTVYLAERDDDQFRRRVALKLVTRGMDTEAVLRRFRYERQILASLEHPHIARLYDGGVSADGRPYLAMEFVDGAPLDKYCDAHALPIDARLALFLTVCEAVQYAHHRLVVHRDLKPSNILVTASGDVKLLDFGIAKLLTDAPDGLSAVMTQPGVRVMTPAYASPEQLRGGTITTATDVYALGLILYELLTGRRPHEDAADPGTAVLERDPERPSAVVTKTLTRAHGDGTSTVTPGDVSRARSTSIDRLQQHLRGDLDTIVLKALRIEPDRRYASAEAFLDDIKRYLAGLPVTARPATTAYRLRKFIGRHRLGVTAATAFVVLLLGFAATTVLQARRIDAERQVAQAVSLFMEDLFAGADPFSADAVQTDTLRIRDFLQRGVARVDQDLNDQPTLQARLRYVLGRVHYKMGLYDQAEPLLTQALQQHRSLFGADDLRNAEITQTLAGLHEETGAYAAAEPLYREALELYQTAHGPRHPAVAQAMSQLGYLYRVTGDLDQAEPLIREALAINRRLVREPDVAFANSLTRFGIVLQEKGDYAGAAEIHQEALAVRRQLFTPGHPRLSTSTLNVAVVLSQLGDFAAAEPLAREALAIAEDAAGRAPHIKTAQALTALGTILQRQGRLDEARSAHEAGLAIFIQLLGEANRQTATAHLALGTTLSQNLDLRAAYEHVRTAQHTIRAVLGDEHPLLIEAQVGLADVYRRQGRFEAADTLAQQALDLAERLHPVHPRTASAHYMRARIAHDRGDHRLAESYVRAALDMYRRTLPPDHLDVLVSASWLGACLTAQGRYDDARALLEDSAASLHQRYGAEHPHTREARRLLERLLLDA